MFEGIWFIVLAAFALGGIWAFVVSNKVKKEGIETDAVVSRVKLHVWSGGIGEAATRDSVTEEYDITYTNQQGQTVESTLTNPGNHTFKEGDRIRIKYLPERQDYPVLVNSEK